MEAIETAITAGLADASGLVTGAVAALFAIPLIFTGVRVGKRLLSKV